MKPAEPSPDLDPSSLLARYSTLVRAAITPQLRCEEDLAPYYGMMAYHLGWVDQAFAHQQGRSGKSVRPALCLLFAEGLGARAEDCAPLAAGIELLHNFTLVHDDIEDRSPTRRGRPTAWAVWGEAQSINMGDGLFALAHLVWHDAPLARRNPAAFIEILRSLERTILTLCEGQFLDIAGEGSLEVAAGDYLRMVGRKTAALLGESAWVGARAATEDPVTLQAVREFGYRLGLAFQIRDDLLGIWGAEEETGKSASSDIATRKMTLPVVLALEQGDAEVRRQVRAIYGRPPADDDDADRVRALLSAAGADRLSAAQEEDQWRAAMEALDRVALAPAWRDCLTRFAQMLVARRG
jgi:geranylgeranyl diphosphate synthase type I